MPRMELFVREDTRSKLKMLCGRRQMETGERWSMARLVAMLIMQEWDRVTDVEIIEKREAKARLRRELMLEDAAPDPDGSGG
jgi:hypothetical protein